MHNGARFSNGGVSSSAASVYRRRNSELNYFAHGMRFAHRPFFLAGTAVPDWLSVVDRRVRMRPRYVEPHVDGSGSPLSEVAAGVQQHLDDDRRFHRCQAFVEISSQLATAFRDLLPGSSHFRPGFLGHVVTELVLDRVLILEDPYRLDRYYDVLQQVDSCEVQAAVNRMARGGTTNKLATLIERFCAVRFLEDYRTPEGLLYRLNQLLKRIKLAQLSDESVSVIRLAEEVVEPRVSELLGWSPENVSAETAKRESR